MAINERATVDLSVNGKKAQQELEGLRKKAQDLIRQLDAATQAGDTVWRDRWRTVYRETVRRDTIYRETRDTVAVPYPVETRPTLAQRIADAVAAALAMAVVAAGIWLAVRAARGRG